MTIQSQTTRVDYTGNGATTNFPVPFYWLQDTDLLVIRTDNAYTPPTVATLGLTTDYVVTGSGNQSGGSITTTVAPTATQKLSILRNVPFTQLTHYVPNDPFPAASHEQALDKLTMEMQQLNEGLSRSITLPPNATGLGTNLPLPAANNLIGWNPAANALQNVDPTTIATSVTYGNAKGDLFSGNGATVNFNLSANPGGINNLDVSISGVTQRPGIDYTWTAGTTLTFTTAPASGTNNILVRYTQALPIGTAAAGNVAFDGTTLDQQLLYRISRVVDSIGALRMLSKTTYTRAFVTGYYAAGDGGGGPYWFDPSDTSSADNGVTVIVASDGGRWKPIQVTALSAKQAGAKGDGSTDDSAVFGTTVVPQLVVKNSTGNYVIATNTTVAADLIFQGGVITVNTGVTLTINGNITAPSNVIFKGAGTVIINKGEIDCSWFDGTDASSKFAFLARGLNNSNGLTRTVKFPTPASTDAWAAISSKAQWGYGWKVTSPILVTQLVGNVSFRTPAPFIATASIASIWDMGNGTSKADGWHFLDRLLLDGSANNATNAMLIEGASSWSINAAEIHNCVNGINITPSGGKQVSGFRIGQIICGELASQGLIISGGSSTNSVTEGIIEEVLSYGLSASGANYFTQIQGNVQNLRIGKVSVRAVNAGTFDYALGAVFITNTGGFAPTFGVELGYVLANSSTPTAKAVVIGDSSGGTGPKVEGVTISGALSATQPSVTTDWCTDTNIRNVDNVANIAVGANALDTWIQGSRISNVTDNGTGTRIEGKVRRIVTLANNAATSIPLPTYVTNPVFVTGIIQSAAQADMAVFYGRCAVALAVAPVYVGTSATVVTGVLSGTTGAVGKLNYSAGTNAIYVENQTGGTQTVVIEIDLND